MTARCIRFVCFAMSLVWVLLGPTSARATTTTPGSLASDEYDVSASARTVAQDFGTGSAEAVLALSTHPDDESDPVQSLAEGRFATNAAGLADDAAGLPFRSDTSHIFRDAPGHLLEDTAANRSLIQSALDPANLRTTITLPDGATLAKYFKTLPDGTQVWVEVRNGVEITNGGLNVRPR